MHQLNKFFIRFWFTFAVASFIYACYMVWKNGWQEGSNNFVIPAIALIWWGFRKFMTKRLENHLLKKQEENKSTPK